MSLSPLFRSVSLLMAVAGVAVLACVVQAADEPAVAMKSEPAAPTEKAVALTLSVGRGDGVGATLLGRDSRLQLAATAKLASGRLLDQTRVVKFVLQPAGIVSIDETGFVIPLADGTTTVEAQGTDGQKSTMELKVEQFSGLLPINFANDVVPVFTKFGCNSGGCHGKAAGQNGFKLSLLGFEPKEDFEHLVKESRGRRVFPAAPDQSLLLAKPTNTVPHGGGQRMEIDSDEYRLLRRWIAQGMPYGSEKDPVVSSIRVEPEQRSMGRNGEQQMIVVAQYTDGSMQDVTRLAQFEANNTEMAEVSATGLVRTMDLTGDVAVMARYQGQVAVFRASIPLGAKVDNLPKPRNFIDELVFEKLKVLGVPTSPVCDDATFLRRVTVDIAGRLPTVAEAEAFLSDDNPAKRDVVIDRLLDSVEYADYFANKWTTIFRNRRAKPSHQRGTYAFHDWIRDSLYENKPYDHFVRELLAASGDLDENPPVAWYREVATVEQQVEDSAQLFLGLRIQCARCHHHPFEKWSQRDYYGYAAFFSQLTRKPSDEPDADRLYHKRGLAKATHPKTEEVLRPTGLGAKPLDLPPEEDPRQALVDWMSAKDNPFFAPSLVNRYWKHFFNVGLVDPEDDMRVTNPASNPKLLAAAAQHFIDSGFDLKELIRTICRSQTYQLSSEPNEFNLTDRQNYSRYYPKRLKAEVLLDSLDAVTATKTDFRGLPAATRAVEIPDTGTQSYFLSVFGRPEASTACECERSSDANLAQSLHLLNSSEVQGKLASGTGRAANFARDASTSHEDKIRELYLSAFSREPTADELKVALTHIEQAGKQPQLAYEDILWALINTKEFLFNH